MSGAWKNSFDTFFIAGAAAGWLAAAEKWLTLPPGYFTAAGLVFHTAALLSSFPAILYSSKWTLGFTEGWCGIYLLFIPDVLGKIPADQVCFSLRSRV